MLFVMNQCFNKIIYKETNMVVIFIYLFLSLTIFQPSFSKESANALGSGNCQAKKLKKIIINSDEDLGDLTKKFIEKALLVLKNNDPTQFDHEDIDYHSYGIEINGTLDNVIISYMASAKVSNLIVLDNGDSLDFGFDLILDQLQLIGKYNLNFDVWTSLPLFGNGQFGLLLKDLKLSFRSNLMGIENNDILQFTSLHIGIFLGESKVEIENLFNKPTIGKYLSQVLTDILPMTINENQNLLSIAGIGLRALANYEMCQNGVTLSDIEKIMHGFIG